MMNQEPITVQAIINAPMAKVWEYWTNPEDIKGWSFAGDDWEAPEAENDLRQGGKFKTVMAAKDKSASFDFAGTYTAIKEHELIEYDMDEDKRHVKVGFEETPEGVRITTTFDPENENPMEMQRTGWQSILDNFKKYAESKK
jgi:uncharacterized protein YndB with AHSA1/START domain